MNDLPNSNGKSNEVLDFALLQSKIRERFIELGIKRKLLEDNRTVIAKLDYEKHELKQRVEKTERELSDVSIHLQVAIKAAREAEGDRATARELLARQGAQLEAASREREFLQQSNRALQLERDEVKRELEDIKSKMATQTHYWELLKKKDSQHKSMNETLSQEINKLEKRITETNDLCSTLTHVTKVVTVLLEQQKTELAILRKEKLKLHEEVISLKCKCEELENCGQYKSEDTNAKLEFMQVWEENQEKMRKRLECAEEENKQLRSVLDSNLQTMLKLQASENQLSIKLRNLEEELEKKNEKVECQTASSETQTELEETQEEL